MNNLKIPFACSLMAAFLTGNAQDYENSVRAKYRLWQEEQRKIILLHMHLSEPELMAFWPVYADYQQDIEGLEIEYLQIMELQSEYAGELKESEKTRLYAALLDNDFMLAKMRKRHYKKLCAALSSSQATEFMRLDYALRTLFRIEIQKNTPILEISETMAYSLNF